MWWKQSDGHFINSDAVIAVAVHQDGSDYQIAAFYEYGGDPQILNGTWTTSADAEEAAGQLVQGFDPATLNN